MWLTSAGSGAWPSSGFTVSRTSNAPLYTMNAPTAMPTMPSRSTPVRCEMMAHASTTPVEITSLRESTAVASSVVDEMRRPIARLNTDIGSFTRMESTSTATTARLNSVAAGLSTLSSEGLDELHADDHDDHGYSQAREVFIAPMAVGVAGIGGLARQLEAQQANHVARRVGEVVQGIGNDGDRTGNQADSSLAQAQSDIADDANDARELPVSRAHCGVLCVLVPFDEVSHQPFGHDFGSSQEISSVVFSDTDAMCDVPLSPKRKDDARCVIALKAVKCPKLHASRGRNSVWSLTQV